MFRATAESMDACGVVLSLLVIVLSALFYLSTYRKRGFPPGPRVLPILGSFPFLPRKPVEEILQYCAEEYGDVCSVKLGSKWAVLLSGFDTVKAAFVERGPEFAGRADEPRHFSFNPHNAGIINAEYTESLKDRRKFVTQSLKNFGFGKRSLGSLIQEEVEHTISVFRSHGDRPFDPMPHLHVAVGNVICSLLFGKRFREDDEQFSVVLDKVNKLHASWIENPAGDFIPFLRLLPSYKKTIESFDSHAREILKFIRDQVREHQLTFDPDHLRDVTDACLYEMMQGNRKSIDDLQTLHILLDFFMAGSNTITVTLEWALLYLVNRPSVQRNMQNELDAVLKENVTHTLKFGDRVKLPYTEAVIMEIQRFASILPVSVGRDTPNRTNFNGFTFPKGLWIFPNIWGVLRDPDLWCDPEIFRPERFITEEGATLRPEYWIPFGMGRRACPGENLARQELFLFVCGLLNKFTFAHPVDGGTLSEERTTGGIVVGPHPYRIKAVQRE